MKPKKKKTKKSPSPKKRKKSGIKIISGKDMAAIDKLGIDLAAGLSNKEISAIEKLGIDIRGDSKKFWNSSTGISIKASAEGKPDPYAKVINVYEEAAKVRNFKQLEKFLDIYSPGMDAALAAKACIKYTQENWDLIKISKNPENHGPLFELLDWIDRKKGGAKAAFDHRVLKRFTMLTGYKKPPTFKTFQNQVTEFKSHFDLVRKKTGEYTRKQLEAAKVRLEKKNSRYSIK